MSALNWCISSRYTGQSTEHVWQNGQLLGCSIYIPLIPRTDSRFNVWCEKLRLPLAYWRFRVICRSPCTAIWIRVNQRLRSERNRLCVYGSLIITAFPPQNGQHLRSVMFFPRFAWKEARFARRYFALTAPNKRTFLYSTVHFSSWPFRRLPDLRTLLFRNLPL